MSTQDVLLKLRSASTGSLTRTAALIGIVAAVAGPFLMLTVGGREANNLPWYIWMIVPLLLLVVVSAGFLAFKRESHDAEDISIRPKNRS
jgi:type IV secretory pathway VirB2 component (pilin)